MAGKKSATIGARISDDLRRRLDDISVRYRVSDAAMLEDALTALADYVESRGKYEWPMSMVYDEARARELEAAEEPGPFGSTAPPPPRGLPKPPPGQSLPDVG